MNLDDAEIAAIRQIYDLLKPFDRSALERIIGYVGGRLSAEANATEQERWESQQKECAAQVGLTTPGVPPLNYAIGHL